jgi:hypothetical protein
MLVKLSERIVEKYQVPVEKPYEEADRWRYNAAKVWVNLNAVITIKPVAATPPSKFNPDGIPSGAVIEFADGYLTVLDSPEEIAALASPPACAREGDGQ